MEPLARRVLAEALGTAFLLAAVIGSGIMAETLSPDSDGVALLANTVATGAILAVLITIFGPVSGAHFNPAVTLAMRLTGDIGLGAAVIYVAAQAAGGLAGAALAHAMFAQDIVQVSTNARAGGAQLLSEAVATFGLVLTIYGGLRYKPSAIPALVGLYITSAYWFTASTSFANPAVTLARAFTDTFSGIRPDDAPGFVAAQCAGAVAAVVAARAAFGRPRAAVTSSDGPAR